MNATIQKKLNKSGKNFCEVCKKSEILVEHHINGRKIVDANKRWNLCYICSNCHNSIHHGIIIVEKWLQTTLGPELFWHYKNGHSLTNEDAKCHQF